MIRRRYFPPIALLAAALVPAAYGYRVHAQSVAPGTRGFSSGWENGTPVLITGEIAVFQTDDAAGNSRVSQSIRDERTGRWFVLRFEGARPALKSGARVRITGRAAGEDLYVAACCDAPSTAVQVMSEAPSPVTGDQRTLVMIGDLLDASVSCSTENVRDTLFAPPPARLDEFGTGVSVNAEHQASSYGLVSWSGHVGRATLKVRSADACDLAQYSAMLDAHAAASGVDVDSFPRKLYVLPPMTQCPFVGASTVGGARSSSFSLSCDNRGLYSHELGHALGMSHAASFYDAYTAGSGNYNNLLAEYNDYSDSMGASGSQFRGFNAPHREQMGWLADRSVQMVTESGRYDLAPLSVDPALVPAPQVLKIPRAEGGSYYLSYRGGQGFDRYIPSYATRVSVHRFGAPADPGGFTILYATLANGLSGQDTFVDTANGVTVRMVSGYGTAPGNGAIVDIQLQAACVRATPSLVIAPRDQSGTAGASPAYTIALTNNDAPMCPAAAFDLGGAVPAGWTGTLSADRLTLAPGANGQAVFTVTAASAAPAGTYTARVNGRSAASIVHAVSSDATYTILDAIAPGQPQKLTATLVNKSKQIRLSWADASDNVGVSGYLISRNGATVATTTSPGWNDPAWVAGATYTYVVRAFDTAGNMSAESNAASITLPGGGGGKNR